MKNRKGFTIVELVIVIAVIAILAAVLIPTFSSVTASAKASAAQQQAKAGLDSILALTGGSLPEGTLFAISDSSEHSYDYAFVYAGNKLGQVEVDKSEVELYGKSGEYAIYVSSVCWPKITTGMTQAEQDAAAAEAATKRGEVEALLKNVLKERVVEFKDITAVAISTAKTGTNDYYDVTVTGATDTTPIRVYYTSDIQTTMVVFVGNDN